MFVELALALLVGVIAGILATFLTVFLRLYWSKVILPWYEERIYKDAHIEGRWTGSLIYPESFTSQSNKLLKDDEFVFEIQRKSHTIDSQMISKKSGKYYPIQGEFRNLILTMMYSSPLPHTVDRGCFSFILKNNGSLLEGYGAFYYPPGHTIESAAIKLVREDTIVTVADNPS